MPAVVLDPTGRFLTLESPTIASRFHAVWLRDNAPDPESRAPGSGQKLVALSDIPVETRIGAAQINGDRLDVTFVPENKMVGFDLAWLEAHTYDRNAERERGWIAPEIELWDAALMQDLPIGDLSALEGSGEALLSWLASVNRCGFGRITGGPIRSGALFRVVDLFGHVRETNYGRHFEVRTELNPTNLAFTGLGLQAHTDNPYRDPVPTVQVLYCLESSSSGGENRVVDGFAAVRRLKDENEDYFDVLADHCARFEYAGEAGVCLSSRRPMIELAPDGELIGVRFNNRSLAAVTDVPFEQMETWYAAYRRLGEIIDDPRTGLAFRLGPGEAFVVDNTRVLHARKAYSGTGTRWLQGCYADKDGLRSTHDAMRRSNAETLT